MSLIDANILIYAYDESSPFHNRARSWVERILSRPEPVYLPWAVVLAFVRITTDRRILEYPFSLSEATEIVQEWLDLPMVKILQPGSRHWLILRELLATGQAVGSLVTDAHLATLAIEHGATLYSTDRDFSRFENLNWQNPLDLPGTVHEVSSC